MFLSNQLFRNLFGLAIGAAVGFVIGGLLIVGNPQVPCVFMGEVFPISERISSESGLLAALNYPDCMNFWGIVDWLIVITFAGIGWFIGSRIKREIEEATTIGGP